MVIKELKPSIFHTVMLFSYGRSPQQEKVREEIRELAEALAAGDREHIVEELADVEIVIPYLIKMFMPSESFKIQDIPGIDFEYKDISEVVVALIDFRVKYGDLKIIRRMLRDSIFVLSVSLHHIYVKYKISREEVEAWKEEKYRRCLKNVAKKVIGG